MKKIFNLENALIVVIAGLAATLIAYGLSFALYVHSASELERATKCAAAKAIAAQPAIENPTDEQLARRVIAQTIAESEVCQ